MSDLKKEKNRSMKDLRAVSFYDFKNQEGGKKVSSASQILGQTRKPKLQTQTVSSFLLSLRVRHLHLHLQFFERRSWHLPGTVLYGRYHILNT